MPKKLAPEFDFIRSADPRDAKAFRLAIERESDIDHSVLTDYLQKPEFVSQVRMVAKILRPRLKS